MKPEINWDKVLDNLPVKILALLGALFLFLFHRIDIIEQKELILPIELVLDPGFVPLHNPSQRVKVLLRGPKASLESLLAEDLQVQADFSSYQAEGTVTVPLNVLRLGVAAELPDMEIVLDPLDVQVDLEKKISKILDVQPQFTGTPAPGYEMTGTEIVPTRVTAVGPKSLINRLQKVVTEKVDILGQSEESLRTVKLLSPDSTVRFLTGPTVTARISIRPIQSTMVIKGIQPQVRNLSPKLKLVRPLGTVSFTLTGKKIDLDSPGVASTEVEVDLGAIHSPGAYEISPEVLAPYGLQAMDVTPEKMTVYLDEK